MADTRSEQTMDSLEQKVQDTKNEIIRKFENFADEADVAVLYLDFFATKAARFIARINRKYDIIISGINPIIVINAENPKKGTSKNASKEEELFRFEITGHEEFVVWMKSPTQDLYYTNKDGVMSEDQVFETFTEIYFRKTYPVVIAVPTEKQENVPNFANIMKSQSEKQKRDADIMKSQNEKRKRQQRGQYKIYQPCSICGYNNHSTMDCGKRCRFINCRGGSGPHLHVRGRCHT